MHMKTKKYGFTLKYVVWDNYTTGTVWRGIYHRLNTTQCHTEQLFSVSMTQNFSFVTKRYALKNLYKCVSALWNIVKKHILLPFHEDMWYLASGAGTAFCSKIDWKI